MLKQIRKVALACGIWLGFLSAFASAAMVEQVISREDPAFDCALAAIRIGQDGLVYVCSRGSNEHGVVLRLNRDGSDKTSGHTVYAAVTRMRSRSGRWRSSSTRAKT